MQVPNVHAATNGAQLHDEDATSVGTYKYYKIGSF